MKEFSWIANQTGRLTSIIKKHLPQFDKQTISDAIRYHRCRINGKVERFESYKVQPQDKIDIVFQTYHQPRLIFNNNYYSVYEKPACLSTEQLVAQTKLHIVHRLDRDTSGCILLAHTKEAQNLFFDLFKKRKIKKLYLAVVFGVPKQKQGTLTTYTAPRYRRCGSVLVGNTSKDRGKLTTTRWEVLKTLDKYSLVLCSPITGRTHQIRLHMQTLGHPIVGDIDYGSKEQPKHIFRPLLHAYSLQFLCPFTQKPMEITSSSLQELTPFI